MTQQLDRQFERMAAKIDQTLNRQGLLSATQRNAFVTSCKSKAKKKEWHTIRTEVEKQIYDIVPHLGVFVERHYFEDDESYVTHAMYALFFAKERLSPWYYTAKNIVGWVKPNQYVLRSYIHLRNHLHAQRPPNEPFMRMTS